MAGDSVIVDVITTLPNRYNTFDAEAPSFEEREGYNVYRVSVPKHNSGMRDQIMSFKIFYEEVNKIVEKIDYDLVVASSSRLFTAYLGYTVAKRKQISLYLDVRDIFVDTIKEVVKNKLIKFVMLPLLKCIEKITFSYAKHINLISEGFKPYFEQYKQATYSYYTNGIDDAFIEFTLSDKGKSETNTVKRIVYAGNIGEGQGLHKVIPKAALLLGDEYEFFVFGDGGAKQKLLKELKSLQVKNVYVINPLPRKDLIKEYQKADFLFIHLNNYEAFYKVLPSKIFELAMFKKTIVAGVSGYANLFIAENLPDSILFKPCDYQEMVAKMSSKNEEIVDIKRIEFISKFKRETINKKMAQSILELI